ncbi:MAG: ethanolamine utilization protein EutH [Eubacteriales bacterium]|nr:ethanolamine utilization protein EutH [Eubacteriales bacterium]
MNFNEIVMLVVAVFFVLGCIDKCLGNKFIVGEALDEGFAFMGPVALGIIGIICLSPVLANLLEGIIVPFYQMLGADAAMFSPTFLSADSGGYAIAKQLSTDQELVDFAGLIVGCLVGPIISFNIPVAIGMIKKEDVKYFAIGILGALIAAPFGCLAGGVVSGISVGKVVKNLVPIFIFVIIMALLLYFASNVMIKIFSGFAKLMSCIIVIGLAVAAFTNLTGNVVIEGMEEIATGFITTGVVTLIIAGAFSLARVIEKVFAKPLHAAAEKTGMNDTAVSNLIISLVTALPAFALYDKMNTKGKIVFAAFAGSVAYIIGPHLGFVSATNKDMILPMFTAKIVAGIIAITLSVFFGKRMFKEEM